MAGGESEWDRIRETGEISDLKRSIPTQAERDCNCPKDESSNQTGEYAGGSLIISVGLTLALCPELSRSFTPLAWRISPRLSD